VVERVLAKTVMYTRVDLDKAEDVVVVTTMALVLQVFLVKVLAVEVKVVLQLVVDVEVVVELAEEVAALLIQVLEVQVE
jgi:hypothetical protein